MTSRPLRVCIDARMQGLPGGIAQVVCGLVKGLSSLSDGCEEYIFLVTPGNDRWVKPFIGGACQIVEAAPMLAKRARAAGVLNKLPFARAAWERFSPILGRRTYAVPQSDGAIESLEPDVVHFPLQSGCLTNLPSIYQPHDLQHRHLPEFFTPRHRMTREILMQAICRQASTIAVASTWVKKDLVAQFGLPPEKIAVIPLAPATAAYAEPSDDQVRDCRRKYTIPDDFIFYPAHTFAHKNHIRLLEALAQLRRDRSVIIPAVFSGGLTDFAKTVQRAAARLGLEGQTHFLGYVSETELRCLYQLCRAVVIPSLFEAASFPLWEAFQAGAACACSNVTSLPRQAGGSAIIFDPQCTSSIADAVLSVFTDETLRATLVSAGHANVRSFTWEKTARRYRTVYRALGNRPISEEERASLAAGAAEL
ncbi:MAG: glycosyltransferase family 4 protein [Planctomycetota bacterium]